MDEERSTRLSGPFRFSSRRAEILGGLLTLLVCSAVVYAFVEIRSQKAKVLRGLTRLAAEDLSHKVEGFFQVRFAVLNHFWDMIHSGRVTDERKFQKTAAAFQKRFPGFLAINWVDQAGVIRWVFPVEPNRAALGKNLFTHPERCIRETFSAAASSRKPMLSPPARLYQGGLGLAAYFPLRRGGEPAGFLNAVFRASRIRSFLGKLESSQGLVFQLREGRKMFIEGGDEPSRSASDWQEGYPIKVMNRTWTVRAAPGGRLLARIFPWTDWAFLALGLSLALGLGWSFFLSRARLHRLREACLALRSSEKRYRVLVENMDEGICLCRDGRVLVANPRMGELLDYAPEEMDRCEMKTFLPEIAGKLPAGGTSFSKRWETAISRRNGSTFPADVSVLSFREGRAWMLQVVLRDLTQRKALEKEKARVQTRLMETQKLESLGLLAGGIAHDFNNLLTGILGNASLAEMQLPEGSPVRRTLGEVVEASRRAASLVRELLAYAGRGKGERKVLDLSSEVERTEKLLPLALRRSIELHFSLSGGLPSLEGDPGQLQQVVMNLLVNAAEAVQAGGRSVEVATGKETLVEREESSFVGGVVPGPGNYVLLRVVDDGPGMGEETLSRIFDPFFSTKGPGRGLGLAAVMGIVKSWGGGIRVESALGKGTRVEVLFPAGTLPLSTEEEGETSTPPGGGTILVVDDEPMVGNLAKEALEGFGFRVLLARSGDEGLETFRRQPEKIDLVVLDMVMPKGLNGRETYEEIIKKQTKPYEWATNCIYPVGGAHSPRGFAESLLTARDAAGRALVLLGKGELPSPNGPYVAEVKESLCMGCGLCVDVCPYSARYIDEARKVAVVRPSLCDSCGACVAACPNDASYLREAVGSQSMATLDALLL